MIQRYKINDIIQNYYIDNLPIDVIAKNYNYKSSQSIYTILRKYYLPLKDRSVNINKRECSIDIDYFKNINTPNKAYILGLLFADGYLNRKLHKISLSSKDIELIQIFKKELKSENKLCEYDTYDKRTKKIYKSFRLSINSKLLYNDAEKLGLSQGKSFTCKLPQISNDLFWHFFRGLFDGDGTIYKEKDKKEGILRFSIIGSNNMIKSIKIILDKMGMSDTKISVTSYGHIDNYLSRLHYYSFKDLKYLKTKLYENSEGIRLDRKFKVFQTLKEYKIGEYIRKEKNKVIKMYDLNFNYIKSFKNINEVIKEIGGTPSMIYRVLNGVRAHSKGYIYKYDGM